MLSAVIILGWLHKTLHWNLVGTITATSDWKLNAVNLNQNGNNSVSAPRGRQDCRGLGEATLAARSEKKACPKVNAVLLVYFFLSVALSMRYVYFCLKSW